MVGNLNGRESHSHPWWRSVGEMHARGGETGSKAGWVDGRPGLHPELRHLNLNSIFHL